MLSALKRLVIESQVADWRGVGELDDGYTILLPSPMDIPFMLRLGLEGILNIDTSRCRQILIIPDGWGTDDGAALKRVAAEFDDPRIEYVDLTRKEYRLIRSMRPPGSAATHWMLVVNGTRRARCEYAFLHDADAFFLDTAGLERQYEEAATRGMHTLGVQDRWDPFYREIGYTIPGTWELMYSVRWARSWKPYEHKGRLLQTPHGKNMFDSMLYPQYRDYESGKVGVMEHPPEFVHFNGTIFSYRLYRDAAGEQVADELFRVLLLSLIQTCLDLPEEDRPLPPPEELSRGLTDADAPVGYRSEKNRIGYGEFRTMVEQMCGASVFAGARAERIRREIEPFDRHFEYDPVAPVQTALTDSEMLVASTKPSPAADAR